MLPVYWVYEDGQGSRNSIALPGPGGEIRFAVGEPGRRSGTWKIWATSNQPDVYIVNREIGSYQKWSLHKSDDWLFQWTSRHQAWEFAGRDDRLIKKSSPPPELWPTGWTRAFIIRFPHQDIVPVNDAALRDNITWLPAPDENHMINVFVIVAKANQSPVEIKGLIAFGGFSLSDERVVLLFAARETLSDEQNQRLVDLQSYGSQAIADTVQEDDGVTRMLTLGRTADGAQDVWELTVDLPRI